MLPKYPLATVVDDLRDLEHKYDDLPALGKVLLTVAYNDSTLYATYALITLRATI